MHSPRLSAERLIIQPAETPSAVVRALLDAVPPRMQQLEAFCSDYYPLVYQQQSEQMSRERRVHILLEFESERLPALVAQLQMVFPDDFANYICAMPAVGTMAGSVRRSYLRNNHYTLKRALAAAGLVLSLLLASWLVTRRTTQPSEVKSGVVEDGQAAPELTSTPSGAEIVYGGQRLGATPFALNKLPRDVKAVCLRALDCTDQIVELRRTSTGFEPLHVYLTRRCELELNAEPLCGMRNQASSLQPF